MRRSHVVTLVVRESGEAVELERRPPLLVDCSSVLWQQQHRLLVLVFDYWYQCLILTTQKISTDLQGGTPWGEIPGSKGLSWITFLSRVE